MIRRAIFAAAVLAALSTSSVLAATKTVSIYATTYTPTTMKVAMGNKVQWKNTTGKSRKLTADAFFLASWFWPVTTVAAHSTSVALTFPEAGTFTYHDSLSASLHGTIVVPMKADQLVVGVGQVVSLTLGTVPTYNGGPVSHIVQARVNGGAWGVISTTTANSVGFSPTSAGTWEFQTRLRQALNNVYTGWTPSVVVTAVSSS
jgi:plastocyanin